MHTTILSSFTTAQYLLVLPPSQAVCDELMELKKYFGEKYDCAASVAGKPNIILARFEQYEMVEQKIMHRLQLVATAFDAFMVELHDFGSLPSHSVYCQVTTQRSITELVKSLRPMQQLLKIDKERKPHFIIDPYIPIARKLLPWQYEKGWLEFSNTHFSGRFLASHFVLLRKRMGEAGFSAVKKFTLLNRKEEIKQGNLFG